MAKDIAIFDLDGCVFDDKHRIPLIDMSLEGDARFEAYHDQLGFDLLHEDATDLLNKAVEQNLMVVFLTARPLKYLGNTQEKLKRHFFNLLNGRFTIYMRPDGDQRPSASYKRDKVREIIAKAKDEGREVVVAFDDRQDVIDMYMAEGVPAWILNGVDNCGCPGNLSDSRFCHEQRGTIPRRIVKAPEPVADGPVQPTTEAKPGRYAQVPTMLEAMAATSRDRYAVYGDNAMKIGTVMEALFPNGYTARTAADHRMISHLDRIVSKLTRFVNSGCKHVDSIHDAAVYAAMAELEVEDHNLEFKP